MYHWDFDKLSRDIWWLTRQTHDAMRKAGDAFFVYHPYSQEELNLLFFVSQQPEGVTLDDLSKWAFRKKNGLARIIDNIEKAGLVSRKKHPGGRSFLYYLTSEGDKVLKEYIPLGLELADLMEQHFSNEELIQFKGYLQRARDIYLARLGIQASSPTGARNNAMPD